MAKPPSFVEAMKISSPARFHNLASIPHTTDRPPSTRRSLDFHGRGSGATPASPRRRPRTVTGTCCAAAVVPNPVIDSDNDKTNPRLSPGLTALPGNGRRPEP